MCNFHGLSGSSLRPSTHILYLFSDMLFQNYNTMNPLYIRLYWGIGPSKDSTKKTLLLKSHTCPHCKE